MVLETPYDFFIRVLQQIVMDIISLLPMIVLAVVVLTIAILAIKLLNKVFDRILKVVELDDLFKKTIKIELPFSLSSLIIYLIDIGILLIALFGLAGLLLEPQQMGLMREALVYSARVISVVIVTIFVFVLFSAMIDRVRVETRMRGYVLFILLILITAMVIDLTALSASTKNALEQGLAIGIGIAVGVFAVWFFFHEYLDKLLLKTAETRKEWGKSKKDR